MIYYILLSYYYHIIIYYIYNIILLYINILILIHLKSHHLQNIEKMVPQAKRTELHYISKRMRKVKQPTTTCSGPACCAWSDPLQDLCHLLPNHWWHFWAVALPFASSLPLALNKSASN